MNLKSLVRSIPDYPKPGILFRDVTTLMKDADGFRSAIDELVKRYQGTKIDKVAGIEARGFLVGGALAYRLGAGLVPVRKHGKLPGQTVGHDYALEYGTDRVEMHTDAITRGDRVLIVDDLLATGGTAEAAIRLVSLTGGDVIGCAFVIDLPQLGGRRRLEAAGHAVQSLMEFEGH